MVMPRKRVTTVAVLFGTLGASGAAQAAFVGPQYYAGVFVGNISGSGTAHDIGATYTIPKASTGTWGLLGGVNFRNGPLLLGAEVDYGIGVDRTVSTSQPVVNEFRSNYHLLARLGYHVNNLDLFLTGGYARIAVSGNTYNINTGSPTTTLDGSSVGVGVDYSVPQSVIVRLQVLKDDYDNKEFGNGYGIKDWSDTSIRAAAIFQF